MTQPVKKFRAKDVTCTVWKNTVAGKDGTTWDSYSFSLQKSYKAGEEWKNTSTLNEADLPKAQHVLSLAQAWAYTPKEEQQNTLDGSMK